MSNSSLPKNSLDSYTITINNDTIDLSGIANSCPSTMSGDYIYSISGTDTITLTGAQGSPTYSYVGSSGTGGTISVGSLDVNSIESINWHWGQEWNDRFPEWNRVKDMCEKYPGLKNAFDNFKVFYEMVKDDYDNPTPKK